MTAILREPLFHFLALGLAVFGTFAFFAGDPDESAESAMSALGDPQADPKRLVVTREALLAFVQARTKTPSEAQTRQLFEELGADAREDWLQRYVREEVLVREARALGLDREDEIIRRRLAQKIEFLTVGLLEDKLEITPAELAVFHSERGEDYRIPTTVTFAHVFVRDPDGVSMERAAAMLRELNEENVSFNESLGYGDRFLYNRHYVDRTLEEIRSHFGDALAERLAEAAPSDSRWTGPQRSIHGWHLILFRSRSEGQIPPMSEIAALLREDLRREKREAALERAIDALVAQYRVESEFEAN